MIKCHPLTNTNDQMEPKGCNPVEASGPYATAPQRPAQVKATGGNRHVSTFTEPPLCTSQFAYSTSSETFSPSCGDRSVDFDWRSRDVQNQHLDASRTVTSDMSLEKSDVNAEDSPSPTRCPDEDTRLHCMFDDRTDVDIWGPPSAEDEDILAMLDDQEDEDDDDEDNNESGDGVKWGKSISLNSINYINKEPRSYQFKEKMEKKRKEVMNGKFKNLVSQLLKTVGVVDLEKEGESWVDTVSSLAWNAALSVKPDAAEGKAMDPAGYVKVKCVATGSRSESELIKGLVFKKHAAHKHMATNYTNPTLMLIQGMLGHSTGLSSFNSMIAQDNVRKKDNMAEDARNLLEHLEACNPNVVLMEKSAPRDALEKILKMGVTLVVDMKLHRLERIARSTGSPIVSVNNMQGQKLKRCNLLYFERFAEEHAQLGEGGKNSHKTLMFLEDHTCLGCTILLKGSHIEELKKIKSAVQCAVVMAYHFILETSFLMDQEVMLSTISSDGVVSERCNINSSVPHYEVGLLEASVDRTCFPLSTAFHEEHAVKSDLFSTEQISSGLVGSLSFSNWKDVTDEIDIPMSGSTHQESIQVDGYGRNLNSQEEAAFQDGMGFASTDEYMKPYPHLDYKYSDTQAANSVSVLPTNAARGLFSTKPNVHSIDENLIETPSISQSLLCSEESVSDFGENDLRKNGSDDSDEYDGRKDDISVVFSESILVLMSSRNANRGTVCEQNHFSHIKFYRNFDVPFGMFLRDNILNQSVKCKACGEHPEAHFYYYAHHNKQLTIRVKLIPGAPLPGESSGKVWMWSCCGKCKSEKEKKYTSNLVLVSNAARRLSFGKFLELSFSNYSSLDSLSKCGHSLSRDFLYFFGLGSMVSMFRYSPVAKYTVAVPPQKLEFNAPIEGDWLQKEIELLHTRVALLFKEVSGYLRKIETKFSGLTLNINGSIKEFMDIEKMLAVEILEFEENIKNNTINSGHSMRKLLCLNRLRWELFLEACVWNRRLQLISSAPGSTYTAAISKAAPEKLNVAHYTNKKSEATSPQDAGTSQVISNGKYQKDSEACADVEVQMEFVPCPEELDISTPIKDNSTLSSSQDLKDPRMAVMELLSSDGSLSHHAEQAIIFEHVLTQRKVQGGEKFSGKPAIQPFSILENSRGQWVWNSFSEIREECMKDLHNRVILPSFLDSLRFDSLNSPEVLSTVSQIISEEGLRMHIPLCSDDYIVCDYEGEVSSIIACALAFMKDVPHQVAEKERKNENEYIGLPRAMSVPYTPWSLSSTCHEPDMLHSAPSMSFLESGFSSFDGSNHNLTSLNTAHPEVHLGKNNYAVVCVYAKEFRGLRNLCCPSELDYITSLSRCKIWDAKGGKSRAFFAKTLDDRFILKEIKRTEFESFMKFASEYFKYMKQSFESGNQTCLAKILGIYQVTVRQPKGGKETKHDLVVIEHLSYGRNLSRQYDLKGALHARYTANADRAGDVLLDQNFVNDMNASPLYIGQNAKRLLQRAVWNDTTFLDSINVMDYSLLVGVDLKQKELVCGIIDYLRQYTWDKQFETWAKSSLVVPKNVLPTIISPKEYKKRFRKFMDTHFLTVPDQWC